MPCSGTPSSLPLLWLSSYRIYAIGGGGANSVLNVVSEYDTGLTALDVRAAGKTSIRWAAIKQPAANVLPRGERAR